METHIPIIPAPKKCKISFVGKIHEYDQINWLSVKEYLKATKADP